MEVSKNTYHTTMTPRQNSPSPKPSFIITRFYLKFVREQSIETICTKVSVQSFERGSSMFRGKRPIDWMAIRQKSEASTLTNVKEFSTNKRGAERKRNEARTRKRKKLLLVV